MIAGQVSSHLEAVVEIIVRNPDGRAVSLDAVVDTGFTEYLTLPPAVVTALGLPFKTRMPMYLAGEVEAEFDIHTAWVEWDGEVRRILCILADGDALIGMCLLRGFRLTVDGLDGGPVTIARL